MNTYLERTSPKKLAGLGLIFNLIPLYFVVAAVLKYGFGAGLLFDPLADFSSDPLRLAILNWVLTPILFFGGLLVALALNLYAVFRPRMKKKGAATLSFEGEPRIWNVMVAVLSSLLLATITVYGILKNFTRR
ncbi:MAG TPA: hypothetical protein VKB86_00540 [Pyrinomonadaceae bacterium]|nr:hypothetical protein [Pyrinomonadaceae bacterium]